MRPLGLRKEAFSRRGGDQKARVLRAARGGGHGPRRQQEVRQGGLRYQALFRRGWDQARGVLRQARPTGMVDVCSKTCGEPACINAPSFGVARSSKREFCARHVPGGDDLHKDREPRRCYREGQEEGQAAGGAGGARESRGSAERRR